MLDVYAYTGAISMGACYEAETGATLSVEIFEADQRIRVDAQVLGTILSAGSPWASLSARLLRLDDGTRTVIYKLDGVDEESGTFYFSWVD